MDAQTRMQMLERERAYGNKLAGCTNAELDERLNGCFSTEYRRLIEAEQERRLRTQEPALPWEKPRTYAKPEPTQDDVCPHCGRH